MIDALFRLTALVREGSRRLAWLAVCCLLLISLMVMLDVGLRWLFSAPIHGLEDLVGLAMIVAVIACFPAGFALGANITVRFLGRALGERAHAWLEVFGQAFSFAFIGALAWQLVVYAGDVGQRTTFILQLPVFPAWRAAAALAVLAAAAQGLLLLSHLAAALARRPPPSAGQHVL